MPKIIDFIHVGDYKTGTTWLQKNVFPYHPEIQYMGDPICNNQLEQVLRELVDMRDIDFDAKKLKKKFIDNLKKENNKIIGLSREALSQQNYITGEHAKRNAIRLKEVFGEVKIIYVIREQISMLGSIYSQYIKTGGTRTFEDWFLDPIECKGVIERLKYDKNIKMYQDIFGADNVLVLLFDELKYDKGNFLRKIYTFIECQNVNFIPEEADKKINISLTTGGAIVARFLNGFVRNNYHNYKSTFLGLDKIIYCLAPKKWKEDKAKKTLDYVIPNYDEIDKKQRVLYFINIELIHRINTLCEKIRIGNKISVPKEYINSLEDYFISSNRVLKNKYNLTVDKYRWKI